jgi:flagellar biosynthesis protein FlhA
VGFAAPAVADRVGLLSWSRALGPNLIKALIRRSDMLMATGMLAILAVMIVPIPPAVLDLMLSLSITCSLVVLMVALYTAEPMEFSVFPGLLLVLTLFRLSLNVASTRLILGTGNAGSVIRAFGSFVVQGNYVVGLVIFLILVIIQFVVITKGSGRIAEVAARFTLDAMPGKQMAIDADLNAGLIDEAAARERRKEIAAEADFYGAMDGASKFVRGDAVAGIIITLINILGGFVIGVAQLGMTIRESLGTYTLLTVGDGLVSQIPALLISTAAGIIVTRAGTQENLGRDLASQILVQHRALLLASGVLVLFALIPGLPMVPFLLFAAIAGAIGAAGRAGAAAEAEGALGGSGASSARAAGAGGAEGGAATETEQEAERLEELLRVDPMELEIGYGLIPLVDSDKGGDLLSRITLIRRQCALELGIVVPLIRIRDNMQLKANEYAIKLRGETVASGSVMVGQLMALDSGLATSKIDGVPTTEPVFGLLAFWVPTHRRDQAEAAGYTVIEAAAVIATHLTETIKNHAAQLVGRQEVRALLEALKRDAPALVEDLIPEPINHGLLQRILHGLLEERVPIRDLATILEAAGQALAVNSDFETILVHVRERLGRTLCRQYANGEALEVVTLDPGLEHMLAGAIKETQDGRRAILLPPTEAARMAQAVAGTLEDVISSGNQPIILTSAALRGALRRMLAPMVAQVVVLSYQEIPPSIEVKAIATVRISAPTATSAPTTDTGAATGAKA